MSSSFMLIAVAIDMFVETATNLHVQIAENVRKTHLWDENMFSHGKLTSI